MYTVIQGHVDVILLPKELTVKKPHFPAPPPFIKDGILTSLSQLNISGRMGLASAVQTISAEPPIFTSVGSWRNRMVGASGKRGRNWGKHLDPDRSWWKKVPGGRVILEVSLEVVGMIQSALYMEHLE